jgi:hypothetical protein
MFTGKKIPLRIYNAISRALTKPCRIAGSNPEDWKSHSMMFTTIGTVDLISTVVYLRKFFPSPSEAGGWIERCGGKRLLMAIICNDTEGEMRMAFYMNPTELTSDWQPKTGERHWTDHITEFGFLGGHTKRYCAIHRDDETLRQATWSYQQGAVDKLNLVRKEAQLLQAGRPRKFTVGRQQGEPQRPSGRRGEPTGVAPLVVG